MHLWMTKSASESSLKKAATVVPVILAVLLSRSADEQLTHEARKMAISRKALILQLSRFMMKRSSSGFLFVVRAVG